MSEMTISVICRNGKALRSMLSALNHCKKKIALRDNIETGKHYHAIYANISMDDDYVYVSMDDMPEVKVGGLVFLNVSDYIAYQLSGFKRHRGIICDWMWEHRVNNIAKIIGEERI